MRTRCSSPALAAAGPWRHAARMLAASLVAISTLGGTARGDDIDRVNEFYAGVRDAYRSDLVLLPKLAAMADPPRRIESERQIDLMGPHSSGWDELVEWAQAPEQREALAALATATSDADPERPMAFAQPYGVEGVDVDLIMEGLYTELGDPPLLARADFKYLNKLHDLWLLIRVEAARLEADGEVKEAVDLCVQWLYMARQIANREFAEEKTEGLTQMVFSLERLRDLAYRDFRAESHRLTPTDLLDVIDLLNPERTFLDPDRVRFPRADKIAGEQLIRNVYRERGGPDPDAFGPVLARLATGDHPLQLFSEAARWDKLRPKQVDWYDANKAMTNVFNGWEARWSLSSHDPVLGAPDDFERLPSKENAVVYIVGQEAGKLFPMRQIVRVELSGTRTALAVYGYWLRYATFPPSLTSVRPAFVSRIAIDPYSGTRRPMEFFVPLRDTGKGPRGEPLPVAFQIYPNYTVHEGDEYADFRVPMGSDQFVVYSVGPDDHKDYVRFATQANEKYDEGDYLIWPPVTSLLRKHLADTGQLR